MRIAVIGTSGQLGYDLARLLPPRHHTLIPFSGRADLDITDPAAFAAMLDRDKPDALINTAAYHNVDLCEKETDAAYRTNVIAVREMAKACESRHLLFFQIGTDYVAEGYPDNKPVAESAPVHPNSIYSLTRYGGDCMTLTHAPTVGYVVRSCGLFGIAGCKLKGGLNFVDTMVKMARDGKKLRVVDDQIVAPTPTDDLAIQLAVMVEAAQSAAATAASSSLGTSSLGRPLSSVRLGAGLYHAVAHGETSWYNFAKTALQMANIPHDIEPVPSSTYAAPAKRPRYSVLDNAKLRAVHLDHMHPWEEGLKRYIAAKYGVGSRLG
ncbi:MAG TPA: dTDP-4-dehydrorhamnose reductase [Phycisphaerae bacterium]|jgi:dTDP-4-dehydrorhamnose reductase